MRRRYLQAFMRWVPVTLQPSPCPAKRSTCSASTISPSSHLFWHRRDCYNVLKRWCDTTGAPRCPQGKVSLLDMRAKYSTVMSLNETTAYLRTQARPTPALHRVPEPWPDIPACVVLLPASSQAEECVYG